MSTLAQLRAQVQARIEDLSGIEYSTATIDQLLNDGYMAAVSASPFWPFIETKDTNETVNSGSNTINLAAGVYAVMAVFNQTDGIPLTELVGERTPYDVFPALAQSPGVPQYYRLFGSTLEVYPYPEAAKTFTVEYRALPAVLAAGDSPIFPTVYHQCLVHWAMAQIAIDEKLYAARAFIADRYLQTFNSIVGQMKLNLLGARGDSYPQISDVWA